MKKTIIILLIFLMAININVYSKNIETSQADTLSDIQFHWANKDINYLIEKGCINGYLDGTFKPDWSISIAEFTKILVTSLGYTNIENSNQEHWALNYINKAKELGIIKDGEFTDYNEFITRGEIARMTVRALEEEYPENMDLYKKQITDYNEIKTAYQEYVLKAYVKGIITGYEDNSFKDTNKATRAEATTMIVRMLGKDRRIIPTAPIVRTEEVTKTEMEEIIERLREYGTNSKYGEETFEEDNYGCLNKAWQYWILDTYEEGIENMELLHNRNYKTIDAKEYKKDLLYYLKSWWYYGGEKYHPSDFLDKYIQDTMDYKVIVESEFITDKKLIHTNNTGSPVIRGVFRFRYISHNKPSNILHELELSSSYTKNQGYPKDFKIGQWYEVDIDIHLINPLTNANINWETSKYGFEGYEYLSKFREIEIK